MAARIEDYGLIGDLQTAALVSRHGCIDWLCFPRFDSGACFAALLGDEENGRWSLRPASDITSAQRRYRGDTLVLETELACDDGVVRLIDFMPPRGEAPDVVRIVEGVEGTVPMKMRMSIRFDYGSIVPWVRRKDEGLHAVAGPDALLLATPIDLVGRNLHTEAEFDVAPGDRVPFVLTWFPSNQDLPQHTDAEQALVDTDSFWREWVTDCVHVGRRRDDVAARGARRRAELGLPLLLAARRNPHAPRAGPRGLRRRGPRVARLAAPRNRGATGRGADHVRDRRRAAADGGRAGVAPGLRALNARADRERGVPTAPARRLRRGAGRALPRPALGARAVEGRLGAHPQAAPVARGGLARARRGDLGGARAATALHALQGDGLGRVRPCGSHDRGGRARRASRSLACPSRGDPRRGLSRRPLRDARRVHAVVWAGPARRQPAHDSAGRVPLCRRRAGRRDGRRHRARARRGRPRHSLSRRRGEHRRGRPAAGRGHVPPVLVLARAGVRAAGPPRRGR